MRANAKEAMIQQGDRMKTCAQERAQGATQTAIKVGTVVRIKVDRVDRGKMECKAVPGVIYEVQNTATTGLCARVVC